MAVERAPRKDAVRNRALLVAAAADAFREEGLDVSVNAIARRAGVNVATLYRNFPAKDDLVAAVLEAVLEPLAAASARALATSGPGVLGVFLRAAVELQAEHRGITDALKDTSLSDDVRKRLRGPAVELVEPIARRAHADGELRPDLGAIDLLIALRMLGTVAGVPEVVDRHVDVLLRGLRPD